MYKTCHRAKTWTSAFSVCFEYVCSPCLDTTSLFCWTFSLLLNRQRSKQKKIINFSLFYFVSPLPQGKSRVFVYWYLKAYLRQRFINIFTFLDRCSQDWMNSQRLLHELILYRSCILLSLRLSFFWIGTLLRMHDVIWNKIKIWKFKQVHFCRYLFPLRIEFNLCY